MPFLSWLFGRPTPPPPPEKRPVPLGRPVVVEWKDPGGRRITHETRLILDDYSRMTVMVPRKPPGSLAQVREMSSSYPVEILSVTLVGKEYELKLDYLWEGRRREKRQSAKGPAILEVEKSGPLSVEVLNVSSGGMQLFSDKPVRPGGVGRVKGNQTERQGLIRYCAETRGGYRIGLQFLGGK